MKKIIVNGNEYRCKDYLSWRDMSAIADVTKANPDDTVARISAHFGALLLDKDGKCYPSPDDAVDSVKYADGIDLFGELCAHVYHEELPDGAAPLPSASVSGVE